MNEWVVCRKSKGYLFKNNAQEKIETNFDKNAVGLIKEEKGESFLVWLCNTGLGRFKNGENYLMNAVNYIKDHDTLG